MLTVFYNRHFFYDSIKEKRKVQQISFLYVDLDNFKLINDMFGHQIGDDTLKVISDILRMCCPDNLIFRIGADEFLIAIPDQCTIEELEKRASEIL